MFICILILSPQGRTLISPLVFLVDPDYKIPLSSQWSTQVVLCSRSARAISYISMCLSPIPIPVVGMIYRVADIHVPGILPMPSKISWIRSNQRITESRASEYPLRHHLNRNIRGVLELGLRGLISQ